MNHEIIRRIQEELLKNTDEKTIDTYQRYFREKVKYHGVKTAVVLKIASKYYKDINQLEKQKIFSLCEELLKTDYGEEAAIAFRWAYLVHRLYEPDDFFTFETWLGKYVNSWAKCDDFCNHSVGTIVEKYPVFIQDLKRWAKSENRWLRRGAAVTLILPARQGKFLEDVFEIADILLHDDDDLVQKGYGWMLKEASKLHQQEVFDYIERNKATMPRTALRYAIEKMPQEMKRTAMSKVKSGPLL
jgi:3-methyladenine DNA glycosylase AlkD